MLANMVSSLFTNGQIQTTLVKAKEARRFAEKLITIGKKGDLHRRRIAVAKLRDKDAVKLLFDEIAPSYEGRNGGYTRILKLGVRRGDATEMCLLQLVEKAEVKEEKAGKKETAKKAPKSKKAEAKLEEVAAETVKAEEAKAMGLVSEVYPAEELMDKAMELAQAICANAPIAVKYSKACIDRGMQMDIDNGIALENELFAMCFATEDQKEGMGAFLEKRKEKHFQNK